MRVDVVAAEIEFDTWWGTPRFAVSWTVGEHGGSVEGTARHDWVQLEDVRGGLVPLLGRARRWARGDATAADAEGLRSDLRSILLGDERDDDPSVSSSRRSLRDELSNLADSLSPLDWIEVHLVVSIDRDVHVVGLSDDELELISSLPWELVFVGREFDRFSVVRTVEVAATGDLTAMAKLERPFRVLVCEGTPEPGDDWQGSTSAAWRSTGVELSDAHQAGLLSIETAPADWADAWVSDGLPDAGGDRVRDLVVYMGHADHDTLVAGNGVDADALARMLAGRARVLLIEGCHAGEVDALASRVAASGVIVVAFCNELLVDTAQQFDSELRTRLVLGDDLLSALREAGRRLGSRTDRDGPGGVRVWATADRLRSMRPSLEDRYGVVEGGGYWFDHDPFPLWGRTCMLEEIGQLVGSARRGVTLIEGPPGTGKSTLARYLAFSGAFSIRDRATVFPVGGMLLRDPQLPRRDLTGFRSVLSAVTEPVETWGTTRERVERRKLLRAADVEADEGIWTAAVELLAGVKDRPAAAVVLLDGFDEYGDDVRKKLATGWLDELSRTWIRPVVFAQPGTGIVGARTTALGPFDTDQHAEVHRHLTAFLETGGQHEPDELAHRILDRDSGVGMFLFIRATADAVASGRLHPEGLPDTIDDYYRQMIADDDDSSLRRRALRLIAACRSPDGFTAEELHRITRSTSSQDELDDEMTFLRPLVVRTARGGFRLVHSSLHDHLGTALRAAEVELVEFLDIRDPGHAQHDRFTSTGIAADRLWGDYRSAHLVDHLLSVHARSAGDSERRAVLRDRVVDTVRDDHDRRKHGAAASGWSHAAREAARAVAALSGDESVETAQLQSLEQVLHMTRRAVERQFGDPQPGSQDGVSYEQACQLAAELLGATHLSRELADRLDASGASWLELTQLAGPFDDPRLMCRVSVSQLARGLDFRRADPAASDAGHVAVAAAGDGAVVVWGAHADEPQVLRCDGRAAALAWHGDSLAIAGASGAMILERVDDAWTEVRRLPDVRPIKALRWSSKHRLAVSTFLNVVFVTQVLEHRPHDSSSHDVGLSGVELEGLCADWSPEDVLALGTLRGDVTLWRESVGGFEQVGELRSENLPVREVTWSRGGRLAVVHDEGVTLWSGEGDRFERVAELTGRGAVRGVAWSVDDRLAVGFPEVVALWHPAVGSEARHAFELVGNAGSLAWAPDGRLAVSLDHLGRSDTVVVLRRVDGEYQRVCELDGDWCVFRGDGSLVVGHHDSIALWDVSGGRWNAADSVLPDDAAGLLPVPRVITAAWSSDDRIVTGRSDGAVDVWEKVDGSYRSTGVHPGGSGCVALAVSDHDLIAVADGDRSVAVLTGLSTGHLRSVWSETGFPSHVESLAWWKSSRLAIGCASGVVIVDAPGEPDEAWLIMDSEYDDPYKGRFESRFRFEDRVPMAGRAGVIDVAWSHHGLLAVAHDDGSATVWELSRPAFVPSHLAVHRVATVTSAEDLIPRRAYSLAWSDDATTLAVGLSSPLSSEGAVSLWSGDGQPAEERFVDGLTGCYSVAWSDSGFVAAGQADGSVGFVAGKDGRVDRTVRSHRSRVDAMDWSKDGRLLTVSSSDGVVLVWRFHRRRDVGG